MESIGAVGWRTVDLASELPEIFWTDSCRTCWRRDSSSSGSSPGLAAVGSRVISSFWIEIRTK